MDEVSVLLGMGHWGVWFPVFQNTAVFSSWTVDPWLWEPYTVSKCHEANTQWQSVMCHNNQGL